MLGRERRAERGTERDVSGSYNNVFVSFKKTGPRTSLIVDPPNGRLPPLAPEAQKIIAADRAFRLALLQSTETCKNKEPACGGGMYDPIRSPRFAEQPPRYNATRMNRNDGPEDSSLAERCLTGGIPEFGGPTGSFRRIVQTPGGISIFYDVGQGQGWQRNIVMNGSPHLPASVRQWYGDSRGRWEGDTLVIDVTNFSPKTDFQGSRENLHVVERFTRSGADTLLYEATIEDPTVWTPAVVGEGRVHPAERSRQPALHRAALHRGQLRPAGHHQRPAQSGAHLRRRPRPRSGDPGRHEGRLHLRRRTVAVTVPNVNSGHFDVLKYLKSGAGWPLRAGISNPSALRK